MMKNLTGEVYAWKGDIISERIGAGETGWNKNYFYWEGVRDMDIQFTENEKQSVLEDPRILDLIIDSHHVCIAEADAMGFPFKYHEDRIKELEEAKKKEDL